MTKKIFVFLFFTFLLSGCLQVEKNESPKTQGTRTHSIILDGLERTYTMYIPTSYERSNPSPLLIVLHGGGGKGEDMIRLTRGGFNALADREGFIVVYPDGIENHWNDGRGIQKYRTQRENIDDVGFISDLIDHLNMEFNVDKTRVYAAGISNGGMMAQRLACELTDRLSGIAVISSAMPQNLSLTCTPTQPVSVLIMAGTEDPLIPFAGGVIGFGVQERGIVLSIPQTVDFWVSNDECSAIPISSWESDRNPQDGTRVRRDVYGQCGGGTEVMLYVIEGGGHTWPGGYQFLSEKIIGRTSGDIDANAIIWDFFKRHVSVDIESKAMI